MEFQRYEYLSRRQSPGLSESPTATKWRSHAPNRGCRHRRLGLESPDSSSPGSFFIYTPVYIKNELSSLPRGHLILTT